MPSSRRSSTGTTTSRSSSLRVPASTSWIGRSPETKRPISSSGRWVAERPIRCDGSLEQRVEPLQRERQVGAALGAGDGVHLVDDHRLDPAQGFARLRGQHQEQRLGRRDQDVRRLLEQLPPLLLRRVAGADADAEVGLDPGERPAQVPLDVVVERLQRRDVEQAEARRRAARSSVSIRGGTRRASCRSRSAPGSARSSGRDRGPAGRLRRGRPGERPLEPAPRLL